MDKNEKVIVEHSQTERARLEKLSDDYIDDVIKREIDCHKQNKSDKLEELTAGYLEILKKIEQIENELESALVKESEVAQQIIDEGLKKFTIKNGTVFEIEEKLNAKLEDAHALIESEIAPESLKAKVKYSFEFRSPSDGFTDKLVELFNDSGVDFITSYGIHHASLNSEIRKILEDMEMTKSKEAALDNIKKLPGIKIHIMPKLKTRINGKNLFRRRYKKGASANGNE